MIERRKYDKAGEIFFYRGYELIKSAFYSTKQSRVKIASEWKLSVKNLNTTQNYYLVIKPKL